MRDTVVKNDLLYKDSLPFSHLGKRREAEEHQLPADVVRQPRPAEHHELPDAHAQARDDALLHELLQRLDQQGLELWVITWVRARPIVGEKCEEEQCG